MKMSKPSHISPITTSSIKLRIQTRWKKKKKVNNVFGIYESSNMQWWL